MLAKEESGLLLSVNEAFEKSKAVGIPILLVRVPIYTAANLLMLTQHSAAFMTYWTAIQKFTFSGFDKQ